MRFGAPWAFLALTLVPLVFLIYLLGRRWRNRVLARAGDLKLLDEMALGSGRTSRFLQAVCFAVALVFVVIALARPQFGMRTEIRKGRGMDVVVAVDLSRSMLAQDVVPSRLERSKIELRQLISRLPGDRIGLVGFTSIALPLCPLTVDHAALGLQLAAATPDDLPRGGTSIGRAIEAGRKMLESSKVVGAAKAILIITDGEDHRGDAEKAAEEAKKAGVEVHVIGVGSRTGEPIPVLDENGNLNGYIKDKRGQTVVSRLDEETLQSVAAAGGGLLALPGGSGGLDLTPVQRHLATLKKAELEDREIRVYEERYQWPLVPAFLFLLLASLIRPTRTRRHRIIVKGLVLLLLALPRPAMAGPFEAEDSDVARGNRALAEGRPADAAEAYVEAEKRLGPDPRLAFNKGLAEGARGELDVAISDLQRAMNGSQDSNLRGRAAFALGNAYRKLKKYDEAIGAYKQALLEDPRITGARRNLAITQALKRIQAAQPKDPNQDGEPSDDPNDQPQPDAGPQDAGPQDGSSDAGQQDGGKEDQQQDGGRNQQQDGGSSGGADAGVEPPDAGSAGQQAPEEPKEESLEEQDVQQILDALEEQEKALERKKLLQKIPKGKVEKDW